tara:strand:- start:359 stop:574 length:216 start_codon:yes stop_codon:yes gene_type:complete
MEEDLFDEINNVVEIIKSMNDKVYGLAEEIQNTSTKLEEMTERFQSLLAERGEPIALNPSMEEGGDPDADT